MGDKRTQKNNKGFTLIELIVTVAIMVVLVGILSVTVMGYIDKAKIAKDVQAADELGRAVRRSIVLNEDNIQDELVKGSISANVSWNSATALITDSVDSTSILYYLEKQMGGHMPLSAYDENCVWALDVEYKDGVPSEENLIIKIYLGPTDNVDDMIIGSDYDEQYMLFPEMGSYWQK